MHPDEALDDRVDRLVGQAFRFDDLLPGRGLGLSGGNGRQCPGGPLTSGRGVVLLTLGLDLAGRGCAGRGQAGEQGPPHLGVDRQTVEQGAVLQQTADPGHVLSASGVDGERADQL